MVPGIDLHSTTVCAWELRVRAALLAAARAWHLGVYLESDVLSESQLGLRIIQHNIRSDATKANIWMEQTLNVVWIETSVVMDKTTGLSLMEDVRKCTQRKSVMAELQVLAKKQQSEALQGELGGL